MEAHHNEVVGDRLEPLGWGFPESVEPELSH